MATSSGRISGILCRGAAEYSLEYVARVNLRAWTHLMIGALKRIDFRITLIYGFINGGLRCLPEMAWDRKIAHDRELLRKEDEEAFRNVGQWREQQIAEIDQVLKGEDVPDPFVAGVDRVIGEIDAYERNEKRGSCAARCLLHAIDLVGKGCFFTVGSFAGKLIGNEVRGDYNCEWRKEPCPEEFTLRDAFLLSLFAEAPYWIVILTVKRASECYRWIRERRT